MVRYRHLEAEVIAQLREHYTLAAAALDERGRRALAASEALTLGWGGITLVARATGLSRTTIGLGVKEVRGTVAVAAPGRVRRAGGGRKRLVTTDPTVLADLERLVEPTARGHPRAPLRWTCQGVRTLAADLGQAGHRVSHQWVAAAPEELGYRLQANRTTREGGAHPGRDAQFAHITTTAQAFLAAGEPVIALEATKKEQVGDVKYGGRAWRRTGPPQDVRGQDVTSAALGRVTPSGDDDLAAHAGWVCVGIDHDTAPCAVATIRHWWEQEGRTRYPAATRLLITAEGGGSNSARTRLWKHALQQLADETGLALSVCHLPPGTSKWTTLAQRLVSYSTQTCQGQPLVSYAVRLSLIAGTTTHTSLTVQSDLDSAAYPTGLTVGDAEMAALRLEHDPFHGERNYTLLPRQGHVPGVRAWGHAGMRVHDDHGGAP